MKKLIAFMLASLMVLTLCGCGGGENQIIGKWDIDSAYLLKDGTNLDIGEYQYEFLSDGKVYLRREGNDWMEGTYAIVNDNIIIDNSIRGTFEMEADTLILEFIGGDWWSGVDTGYILSKNK